MEFFGAGLSSLSLADRATIGNMAPEYGATVGFFPVDQGTVDYLRFTGRDEHLVELCEAYYKEQGLFRTDDTPDPEFSDTLELDLSTVEASLAGRNARKIACLSRWRSRAIAKHCASSSSVRALRPASPRREEAGHVCRARARDGGVARSPDEQLHEHSGVRIEMKGNGHAPSRIRRHRRDYELHEHLEPSVMLAAGLWRETRWRRLRTKPWVKTSLAPGSKVVTEYYARGGAGGARHAWLQSRRVRVYDVYRQLRAAAAAGQRRDRAEQSSPPRCCQATATSRGASTRSRGSTISPRHRWSWRTHWPGGWTST